MMTCVATIPKALVLTTVMLLAASARADEGEWIRLFNGKNLDGWRVKIKGYELDDNFGNTFRVEDGLLKVSYDEYEKFDGQYAWGRTGVKERTITRGTPTPVDDIDLLKGQAFVSLSSASPGTTYLTAVAPKRTRAVNSWHCHGVERRSPARSTDR